MSLTTFVISFLAIAGKCLSEDQETFGMTFDGRWYINKYTTESKTDVLTCVYVIDKGLNDTTTQTTLYATRNGQQYKMDYNLTFVSIEGSNGRHFLVIEYYYSHNRQKQVCSFHARLTKNNNIFSKSLCKNPPNGITEWCMSRFPTSTNETEDQCPGTKKFIAVDNSDC